MFQHPLLLKALIIFGVIAFAVFLAGQYGLISLALESDRSYLSVVILTLYAALSLHWLWVAWRLSNESQHAAGLSIEDSSESNTLTQSLFHNLALSGAATQQEQLLTLYHDQLLNRHALGHFCCDLLLRLGLLGTIVGFILMLLPVAEIQEFEPAVMQQLLTSMSGGMAVALYTTMAGLISSTLLRYQYHLLDTAAVDLANRVSVAVQTSQDQVKHAT